MTGEMILVAAYLVSIGPQQLRHHVVGLRVVVDEVQHGDQEQGTLEPCSTVPSLRCSCAAGGTGCARVTWGFPEVPVGARRACAARRSPSSPACPSTTTPGGGGGAAHGRPDGPCRRGGGQARSGRPGTAP